MSNHLIWESLWCHYPATQSKDWTSWEGFVKHNLPVLFLTRPLGWRFGRGDKSSFRRNRIVSYLDFLDVFFWLSFEVAERLWTKHYCTIFMSYSGYSLKQGLYLPLKKHPCLPYSTSSLHDGPIHESPWFSVLHGVFVSKLDHWPPETWYLPEGNFLDKTQSTTSSIKGCWDEQFTKRYTL